MFVWKMWVYVFYTFFVSHTTGTKLKLTSLCKLTGFRRISTDQTWFTFCFIHFFAVLFFSRFFIFLNQTREKRWFKTWILSTEVNKIHLLMFVAWDYSKQFILKNCFTKGHSFLFWLGIFLSTNFNHFHKNNQSNRSSTKLYQNAAHERTTTKLYRWDFWIKSEFESRKKVPKTRSFI